MSWETVIGLEVHAQLNTQSKLFSGSSTAYGAPPNSQASFIDIGLPGVLPVLNQEAVRMAICFGLAIDAEINNLSYFERKNYFYPDLPKGYQISQFQRPIIGKGTLAITAADGRNKDVEIVRAHLEEDAGKSVHDTHPDYTGVDLNRAGTPLLEIVTAPCLYSSEEAITYLKTLRQLVRFLGICDGNMQEGSFRCDVNISLRKKGQSALGTRTELKNLNSFRFIEKAIFFEQARHQDLLESGQPIHQETRLYSPDTNSTHSMRSKESENDYRYFPDPDLLPIEITDTMLAEIKSALPRLPNQIRVELQQSAELNEDDINFLLNTPATTNYFYSVKNKTKAPDKLIINWLKGAYAAALNEAGISFDKPLITADTFADLLSRIHAKKISGNSAKAVFNELIKNKKTLDEIISKGGYETNINHDLLNTIIMEIIANHPNQAADYRAGKEKLLAFFVGQVMKQTKGQANPAEVSEQLKARLSE